MRTHTKHSFGRGAAGLVAVFIVFGLAVLMVLQGYDPAVITTVITGTSLAAAELVRRLQAPAVRQSEPDDTPDTRS